MQRVFTFFLQAFFFAVLSVAVFAQSQLGTGSISGTVLDSNGAAIAGASVTVTNIDKGLVRTLTTNEAGQFVAPVLPVGNYSVRVKQTGFSEVEQNNLTVNVGGTTTLRSQPDGTNARRFQLAVRFRF